MPVKFAVLADVAFVVAEATCRLLNLRYGIRI